MNHDDLFAVARTVFGEARNQGMSGMSAVAWVIRNRTADRRWPNSPLKVSQQRKQFSCWNRGEPNNYVLLMASLDDPIFLQAIAATASVFGSVIPDNTAGANHYHTKAILPYWVKDRASSATIKDHIFYKF